ncbi:MAG: PAS domain-containing protein [Alphaproteobacteria bacterium]
MSVYELIGIGDALRPLFERWDKARDGRSIPARSDFDPLSLPRELLPYIVLLEVQHQPRRFRFRLMGTAVAEMLGEDWTGMYLDQLPKANQQVIDQYEETVKKQAPTEFQNQYIKFDPSLRRKRMMHDRSLLLPLSNDGKVVNMLMGATSITPVN